MIKATPKPAGTWDFCGACAPNDLGDGKYSSPGMMETFTLGCFQWEPMARGEGTKRGKVQYRVKGRFDSPSQAFQAARDYCDRKNAMRGTA